MRIEVLNKTSDFNTYRAARVKGLFNASNGSEFALTADIPIDGMEWQIGLVTGQSGSGKTSIGKQILGGNKIVDLYAGWPKGLPIVEAIGPDKDFNEVTGALASVGLGDVPAWLRPFSALSNGQQFRAGLARALISGDGDIVIDEFTSVVDRQIAMVGAIDRIGAGRIVKKPQDNRFSTWEPCTDVKDIYRPDLLMIEAGNNSQKTALKYNPVKIP